MNFSEKLIELRKQKGLSQEELGYKLNVTRQTISKWELGQTTPEMEKLVEIGKFFDIRVDELLKETKEENSERIIEDKEINKKEFNWKLPVIIIVSVLVIVAIIYLGFITSVFNFGKGIFNKAQKIQDDVLEKTSTVINTSEIQEQAIELQQEMQETQQQSSEDQKQKAIEIQQKITDIQQQILQQM